MAVPECSHLPLQKDQENWAWQTVHITRALFMGLAKVNMSLQLKEALNSI